MFVADAYDAMTAERGPTRGLGPARTEEEAIAELERCAGTQFDPRVIEAFAKELRSARRSGIVVAWSGSESPRRPALRRG